MAKTNRLLYYDCILHIKIDKNTLEQIEKLGKKMNIKKSSIIRIAISDFIESQKKLNRL